MKKALLIGINYINSNVRLYGCIGDVVNMNTVLTNTFLYDDVKILRDDINTTTNKPTRNNILTSLRELVASSANCSEIWIHYSGHGARIRDLNGDEVSGQDSVIVPVDFATAGFIVDDDLYAIIRNSKCRTIILMDSCNSGTVIDLPWSFNYINPLKYNVSVNNKYALSNPEIYMFSGCKDNQTSADTYSVVLNQAVGAFTDSFLTCLKNANYQISLLLLYRNVCRLLQQNGFTQIPVYSSSVSNPMTKSAIFALPPKPIVSTLSTVVTKANTNTPTKINNTSTKMAMIL